MKKVLILLILLCGAFGYAQEKEIVINYTVEYLIPSTRKKATDTVNIGFDKSGKYLWTNSKALAEDIGKSIFRGNSKLMEAAELAIVLDTENMSVIMVFKSEGNEMFMNMELSKIMPLPKNQDQDEFELISEDTGNSIEVAGKKASVYDVYPSNKPSEAISIAFDKSIPINNNKLFKRFFELIFAAEGSSSLLGMDFPNGLLMSVSNKGEIMMEAHKVDTKTKTININYSFKITE